MCKSHTKLRNINLQYAMFGTIHLHNLQSYIKCLLLPIHIRQFCNNKQQKSKEMSLKNLNA